MTVSKDDLRAAVGAGILEERQAVRLAALADARNAGRAAIPDGDEPFELFRGFNEIFIVVGLAILYSGWLGTTVSFGDNGDTIAVVSGALGMFWVALLARYFTHKRRMIAPSIALATMFGASAALSGYGVEKLLPAFNDPGSLIAAGTAAIMLFLYWRVFRVPFTLALTAIAVFVATINVLAIGQPIGGPEDLFLLSAEGPFGLATFLLGLIGFGLAMAFDISDPHRLTRRAANGFWLHIVAGPAIVNTIALTLFDWGSVTAQLLLLAFVIFMAAVAIVIDRRSFLLAAVGYIVALAVTVFDGGTFLAILAFGVILIVLGSGWEDIRRWLMQRLPDFRGKDSLPPYA